jgi:hypothetical protein
MRLDPQVEQSQDVKGLLEENLKYAKEIYASTEKTRRYIFWGQVFGFLKILIIIVPLILGFLYVQPYLKSALGMYTSLFGQNDGTAATGLPNLGSSSDLIKQLEDLQRGGKLQDLQKLLGQ